MSSLKSGNVNHGDTSGALGSHISKKEVYFFRSAQEKNSDGPGDEGLKVAEGELGDGDGMEQSIAGMIPGDDPEADSFASQADQNASSTADPMVGGGSPSATSSKQISSSMATATRPQRDGRVPDIGSTRTGASARAESVPGSDGGNTGYVADPSLGSDSSALSYGLGSVLTVLNEILGRDGGSFTGRSPPTVDHNGSQVYGQ